MNRILIFVLLLFGSIEMFAIPANPKKHIVTQSDGTQLTVFLRGDEHYHYFVCSDGMPVMRAEDGNFYYAKLEEGRLLSSDVLAHEETLRSETEVAFVTESKKDMLASLHALHSQRMASVNAMRAKRLSSVNSNNKVKRSVHGNFNGITYTGNYRQLVILVNYKDLAMKHTNADFDNQFNQQGYNKNQHIGSVRDYFLDQSYGQLDLNIDVVGPYTVSKDMDYYGQNGSDGNDKYAGTLVAEACKLAYNDGVDFSKYDWDGDGEIEQVIVIYSGYSESSGAEENTIWPHQYYLSASDYGKSLSYNGKKIDAYAVFAELYGTSGAMMDGIGTFCHEYSHCLGLPDFYDTSGSTDNFGMSTWSLLDYGCYNGPDGYEGCVPCGYTAYERACQGWLTLTELSDPCNVSNLDAITDSAQAYIVYNEANENEFYVLDNHQQTSWDKYAYGHGMLVTHVDYDEDVWFDNSVNNTSSHQRCTIVPADNNLSATYAGSLAGDPWPGTSSKTELTNTSTPAATLFNANSDGKKYLNKPITNIVEKDGLISFTFNGGISIDIPDAQEATDISVSAEEGNSFTARWSAVPNATSYTLEVAEVDTTSTLMLNEDFSIFANGNHDNAGKDYSSKLDEVLSTTGWTGKKLFTGLENGIKLGSSSAVGTLTTPTLSAPTSSVVTLYFVCVPYNSSSTLNLQVSGSGGLSFSENYTQGGSYAVSIPNVIADFKITFSTTTSSKRAFISAVAIFDGELTLEDIETKLSESDTKSETARQTRYKQMFTGLTDTSYTVKGLSDAIYAYRVKAVVEKMGESDWSNRVSVNLKDAALTIESLKEPKAVQTDAIYDLTGRRVVHPIKGKLYIKNGEKILLK